jgi:hypothetical protein
MKSHSSAGNLIDGFHFPEILYSHFFHPVQENVYSGSKGIRLPIALAACLSAIFRRLLPFGILLLSTLPPGNSIIGRQYCPGNKLFRCIELNQNQAIRARFQSLWKVLLHGLTLQCPSKSTPPKYWCATWLKFLMDMAFLFCLLYGLSVGFSLFCLLFSDTSGLCPGVVHFFIRL